MKVKKNSQIYKDKVIIMSQLIIMVYSFYLESIWNKQKYNYGTNYDVIVENHTAVSHLTKRNNNVARINMNIP